MGSPALRTARRKLLLVLAADIFYLKRTAMLTAVAMAYDILYLRKNAVLTAVTVPVDICEFKRAAILTAVAMLMIFPLSVAGSTTVVLVYPTKSQVTKDEPVERVDA